MPALGLYGFPRLASLGVAATAVGAGGSVLGSAIAGAAVNENDAVLLGPKGKAVPARVTDYAAVGIKDTVVSAEALVDATRSNLCPRLRCVQGVDGSLYVPSAKTGSGAVISKYTAGGVLIRAVATNWNGTDAADLKLLLLSSGNLAVVAQGGLTILDPHLNVVSAPQLTGVGDISTPTGSLDAIALAGGGIAICARNTATQKLAIFSDAGAVVLAATTIMAWTGAAGSVFSRITQLATGNIAIACVSAYATTVGLYHAVYTPAGVAVVAMANLDATAPTAGQYPSLLAVASGYHITGPGAAKVYVRSNVGAAVTNYALTSPEAGAVGNWSALETDGVSVWCAYWSSTVGSFRLVKTDLVGAVIGSMIIPVGTTAPNQNFDVILNATDGLLVIGWQFNVNRYYVVIDLGTWAFYTARTSVGPAINSGGTFTGLTDLGDYVFAMVHDVAYHPTTAGPGTYFALVKYAASGLIGVATAASVSGDKSSVRTGGNMGCNPLKGRASMSFDHVGGEASGGRGSISPNNLTIGVENLPKPATFINATISNTTSYTVPAGKKLFAYASLSGGSNVSIVITGPGGSASIYYNITAAFDPSGRIKLFAGPGSVIATTVGGLVGLTGELTNSQ